MVVKFFLAKHQKAAAKHKNKKIAVGQLLGSKTDVREAEDDDGREDDNVSALELALNHSDTVAVDAGNSEGAKKLYNFRLIPPMISRRKGSQNAPPSIPTAPNLPTPILRSHRVEKRDDCTDKSLVDLQSQAINTTSGLNNVDKQSMVESVRIEAPLEVTVTPEALSGLMLKRNAQPVKTSSGNGIKGNNGVKVKGYIRVVGKAPGVKIVSGTTKIVKSYRLGTSTTPNSNSNHSTLTFSNPSTGMKPTGSLRIRLPPPSVTATSGAAKYEVLTFEVGVLTPEGIFPLGTSAYQPLQKSSKLQHSDVLKVDPIHKGSIFQRRKSLVASSKSATTAATIDKDSNYRLLRKSKLSLQFDIKPLSDKEYTAHKQKQELKSMNNSIDRLPKSQSSPALDSSNGNVCHESPEDGTTPRELQHTKSDPSGNLITYLSDPLSCCSDRDVDSADEEAIPDDAKTQVTEPYTDILNEDVQVEKAVSTDDIEPDHVVQDELQRDTIPPENANTETFGWCFFFPICCCVGASNKAVDHNENNETMKHNDMAAFSANDIGISSLDTIVHDAGIPPKYLDQGEQENDEPLNRSRHRYGYDVNAVIRSDSDTNGPHDRSVVGTRNCCMECFGDEDVENLKFTKFKSIQDEQELLVETNESTDAKYDEPVEDKCQFDSHEPNYSKQNETTDEVHHNKTFVGIIEMMEADEIGKDKSDTDEATAPPVYAGLDTMSSSYAEDDDAESVYSVSFSDIDGNVGCFQWMGAVSSEGLDVDNSMSVVSSESQGESLEGIVVDTSDAARIPISKSEDIATVVPTSNMKNKLLVHSNSIS